MGPSVTLSFEFPGGLLSPGISLFYLYFDIIYYFIFLCAGRETPSTSPEIH